MGGYLKNKGFDVVCTDTDFFKTEPPKGCQAIISNPPFSRKKEVMDRTKELEMKFVYILPFTWLNDLIPLEYGNQIVFFRKRMHFQILREGLNKPRANCFVLSNGLLKKDLDIVWD